MTIRFNSSPQASDPALALRLHLEAFDDYLRNERGLVQTTIDSYTSIVGRFLCQRFASAAPQFDGISSPYPTFQKLS